MNTIWIVLPILTLLMFELGLTLRPADFSRFKTAPLPILTGLFGQLVILPLIAFFVCHLFQLPPYFAIGIMLIACSPGGSSSNVFSMVAKGDLALSVSLTTFSSLLTLITLPFLMQLSTRYFGAATTIHLPVGNLLVQNLALMLLPIMAGIAMRQYKPSWAQAIHLVLGKIAFFALLFLATVFFIQHRQTIAANYQQLGACITLLILLSTSCGGLLAKAVKLNKQQQRTLVIEVGMQNAAQAIAVASSPFVFNNDLIAIPAIIYALMMNVILLIYVQVIKK